MKKERASRAMEYIDDKLVLSAMDDSDLNGQKKTKTGGIRTMKKTLYMKWGAIAAAFVFVISAVIIAANVFGSSNTIIALDVNPSIEIEIDDNNRIEDIDAVNRDAERVLESLNLEGKDIDIAVNEIIGALVSNGFLSENQNSILVSIDADNSTKASELKEKVSSQINTALEGSNITASVITQDFERGGEAGNVSAAKSNLIKKIIKAGLIDAGGVPYTFEKLAKLNVNELKLIIESKGLRVDGINSTGNASAGNYISAEEALEIALNKAALAESDITRLEVELDFDDDVNAMVYEIEFVYGEMKYEYEIRAGKGNAIILEQEIEPAKEEKEESVTLPENAISREEALAKAYEAAGLAADSVRRPEIEIDSERGVYVYEIEFKSGTFEYEYTINALTGEVVEWEKEPID